MAATPLSWDVVSIEKPDDVNVVIGQAHFIKTVEDLHEAMVGVSASLRFGLAFCEASGARLVRRTGNDAALIDLATRNALAIAAGHCFVVFLSGGFPLSVLNPVKAVPEVCTIHCATANSVEIVVAVTPHGRGIAAVVDGEAPLGVPRMASDLGSTTTDLQWVISVYMLALGAFMAPAGRIGDIFGRRRTLLAGIALFGVASVFCAVAPSAAVVIVFRGVQGLGAALIFPVSVSVLTNTLPTEKASHAIGLAYGIAGLGNAAGPLVGGLLTQTLGWRAVFWMLVPLAAISLVIGLRAIPETSDETVPRRVDLSGLALIVFGIGLFTFAFDRAPAWGWLSVPVIGVFLAAVGLLATFVAVETRVRFPLIDLSLLRNVRFTVLVVAGTVANIAYVVTVFFSTMNLQQVRGLDPLTAGLAFLGPSVGAALGGPVSGRLASRNKPFTIMGIGCTAAAVSLAVLAASDNFTVYLAALTACGFTMGLVYAFTTVATQAVVAPERAGEAAGVTLTSLVTLAGVGVAVSSSVLEVLAHQGLGAGDGIRVILAVIAALLLPAGLAVLGVTRSKNRASATEGASA